MRLVHVQTTIETVFGVLDDDGNIIPQQPIVAQASVFSAHTFAEAYGAIAAKRDETSIDEPQPAEADTPC